MKKRYCSMDFGVKMMDFLVEHKRLTKIGVDLIILFLFESSG